MPHQLNKFFATGRNSETFSREWLFQAGWLMARMAVVLAGLDLDWPLDCLPLISGDVFLADWLLSLHH